MRSHGRVRIRMQFRITLEKQDGFENLEERAEQAGLTEPNPRQIVKYPGGFEIAIRYQGLFKKERLKKATSG